jgi:hypothetical protein
VTDAARDGDERVRDKRDAHRGEQKGERDGSADQVLSDALGEGDGVVDRDDVVRV